MSNRYQIAFFSATILKHWWHITNTTAVKIDPEVINMFAKIKITGVLEVLSGMHIGGSSAFSAIGSVDSPVIKDALTGLPLLPGSSIKGKLRTLLARSMNENYFASHDEDCEQIRRLFGSAKKNNVRVSRLLFYDSVMNNH